MFYTLMVIIIILFLIFLVLKSSTIASKLKKETALEVFESTMDKHSNYSEDFKVARLIRESYFEVEGVRNSLMSVGGICGLDFSTQIADIDDVLSRYVTTAKEYRETMAYQKDRDLVKYDLLSNRAKVTKIIKSTGYSEQEFERFEGMKAENQAIYNIHRENLNKCDIIRPHNHKAVPLRELSTSLVKMLDNIGVNSKSWELRAEVKNQLEELSKVIDEAVEELNTYDSKRYIENELQISKNLMKELRNAQYVDILSINKVDNKTK